MTYAQAKTCFRILFVPLALLYASLAIPFVGFITFRYLSHSAVANCVRSTEGLLKTCEVNGIDVATVEGLYTLSTFFLGLPYLLVAFVAMQVIVPRGILLCWVLVTAWFWYMKRKLKPDA
jgi:hypothetical protein